MAVTILGLLLAAALGGCGNKAAGGGPDRPEAAILDGGLIVRPSALALAGMDANADFRIDRAELEAGTAAAFTAADTNGSGFLTPVELADWLEVQAGDRYAPPGFMGFDANADQKVTREEFAEVLAGLFDRFDRDNDGAVTRAEMVERLQRFRNGGGRGVPRTGTRRQ